MDALGSNRGLPILYVNEFYILGVSVCGIFLRNSLAAKATDHHKVKDLCKHLMDKKSQYKVCMCTCVHECVHVCVCVYTCIVIILIYERNSCHSYICWYKK